MLHLLESTGMPRERRGGWTMVSAAMHVSVIAALTIAGARSVPLPVRGTPEPERLVYTAPAPPRSVASLPATGSPVAVARPALPVVAFTLPALTPSFDPTLPPSASLVSPWTTALTVGDGSVTPGGHPGAGGVWSERAVDRAVLPLAGNPQPDYPVMLRGAGVQGTVTVRFIVDSAGRVEPGSIDVVRATHTLFAQSVQRWLARTRYAPAQVGGAPVRQMVEQRVEFALR